MLHDYNNVTACSPTLHTCTCIIIECLLQLVLLLCALVWYTGDSGPHRINDKLFSNTRYFVMKSNNFENVDIAKNRVS